MANLYERWIGVRPADVSPGRSTKPERCRADSAAGTLVEAGQELAPIIPAETNNPAAADSRSLDACEAGTPNSPLPGPAKAITQREVTALPAQLFEPSLALLGLPLRDARDAFERVYFQQLMAQEGASIAYIAERSGLERTHLYRKLKALGMTAAKKVK